MTRATSLYYPDFEPPLDWLKAYLLFHDNIARIVPPDVEHLESEELKRFQDAFPDAIQDIPSNPDLVDLDDIALYRLDRAFARVAEDLYDTRQVTVEIGRNGGVSLPGFVFLHRSKVSQAVDELLKKYNLAPDYYETIGAVIGLSREFLIVKGEASNLILSLLADRVARDNGFDSVTSYPLDYSLLALNGMGATRFSGSVPGGHADRLLASVVIKLQIPGIRADITLAEYREIRKDYSDLREPFARLVKEQLASGRLSEITDAGSLENLLREATADFSAKLKNIQHRSRYAFLKRWVPFTVLSLLGIAAALPVSLSIAMGLALITVTAGVIDKIVSDQSASEKDAAMIHRRLVSLRDQLVPEKVSDCASGLL